MKQLAALRPKANPFAFTLRTLFSAALILFFAGPALAQLNIAPGGSVTEQFGSFTSSVTALPTTWKVSSDAGTARQINTTYNAASTTASNTMSLSSCSGISGGTYSCRNTTASGTGGSDYSPGFVSSGSVTNGNLYVALTNNGTSSISSFTISYSVKKYRNGNNAAGFTVKMLTATSPTVTGASWTALGSNFNIVVASDGNTNCPNNTTPGNGANIPNATTSVTSQAYTLGTPLAVGSTVYFAWNYCATSGSTYTNAPLLGIDDVTFSACTTVGAGTLTPTANINLCPGYGNQTLNVYNYSPSGANLQWQRSTTSALAGFSDLVGATSTSYTITSGSLTAGTTYWYRCQTSCGATAAASTAVQVTAASTGTSPTINLPSISTCAGGDQTAYTVSNAGGGNFTGSFTGSATGSSANFINTGPPANYYLQTGSTAGVGSFIYTVSGCQAILSFTANSVPTNLTPTTSICNGGVLNTTQTLDATPTGGTWSLVSSDGTIANTTAQPTSYTPASSGSKTIRYTLNGCKADKTFTVNSAPSTPGTITGSATPCLNTAGNSYFINLVSGLTYTWAMPASGFTNTSGVNGVSGPSTNSISVTTGASGSGSITVYATNGAGCQSSNQSLAVSISAGPAQPNNFTTSTATVCPGSSYVYTVPSVSGATGYNWSFPSGTTAWNITNGLNTNSITVTAGSGSGTLSVAAINGCGTGTARTITVTTTPYTINTQPASTTVCGDNNINLSVNTTGITSYQWQYFASGTWNSFTDGSYGVSGSTTNAFALPAPYLNGWNGGQIRCLLSNSGCSNVATSTANITASVPTVSLPAPSSRTTLLTQNFGTSTGTFPFSGWTTNSTATGTLWTLSALSVSSGYTGASGGGNATISQNTSFIGTTAYLVSPVINATGYMNINVAYGGRMTNSYIGYPTLEYSINGSTWKAVSYVNTSGALVNITNWVAENAGAAIALPADASNVSTLQLRIAAPLQATSANYRIDDFSVTGVPMTTPNVTICGSDGQFSLFYSAVSSGVTQYSVTAPSPSMAGFTPVTNTTLGVSPLTVSVPLQAPGGNYLFPMGVKNTTTGCSATSDQAYLVKVNTVTPPVISKTDITCNGLTDGKVTVATQATGTTGPYTYSLNGGGYTAFASTPFIGLGANSYTVTAKDANGCISAASNSATVVEPSTISVSAAVTSNYNGAPLSCATASDGKITVTASGGTGTLQYKLDAGSYQPGNIFTGVSGGAHIVTVKDANGCTNTDNVTVTPPAALVAAPDNGGPYAISQTIALTANPSGGTGSYSYSWTGPSFTNTNANPTIANAQLSNGGAYNITITDANGCQATGSTTVVVVNAFTWGGYVSNDWTNQNNWSPVSDPGGPNACAANVIIPFVVVAPTINSAIQVGNLQIDDNSSMTLNANLSVCKGWTGGSTTNAQVFGNGLVVLNGTSQQAVAGKTAIGEMKLNNSTGALMQAGSSLDIFEALDLQTGTFTTGSGNLTFKSTSENQIAILDNFSPTFGGTLSGNINAERYFGASQTFNQHFMGSPVNSPSLSQFGASGTGGYVIPITTCDETQMIHTSPYGTVFSYHENHGGTCGMAQWFVETAGNAVNGQGYSILKYGAGVLNLNGTPNLNSTYTISGLTNSNWNNTSLQHRSMSSGWQLVSNPYLATLQITNANAGFDNQVQVWHTDGPFAGSYQVSLVGSLTNPPVIPPFQGFMVHKTAAGGTANYSIKGTDRVRTPHTFYRANDNELGITLKNLATTLLDQTTIAFNTDATDTFDVQYDAYKFGGALNRHTLYTMMGTHWMAVNTLYSEANTDTVAMGLEPGKTGNYKFTYVGVNTFDPTCYIFIEDKFTHLWHDVRDTGFVIHCDSADTWDRFIVHFTPPAIVSWLDATCDSLGAIMVSQPGVAIWAYTLTDTAGNTVSQGTLDVNDSILVDVPAGTYTLTMVDTNNYTAVKVIQVGGSIPVITSMTNNAIDSTPIHSTINFSSISTNADSIVWTIADTIVLHGSNVSYTFDSPGVYTVTLFATNSTGCVAYAYDTILIVDTTHIIDTTHHDTTVTKLPWLEVNRINMWSNGNAIYIDFGPLNKVEAVIRIYNILGQQIVNEKHTTNNLYRKELDNIDAAYVIVSVKNNDQITTRKLFISNKR